MKILMVFILFFSSPLAFAKKTTPKKNPASLVLSLNDHRLGLSRALVSDDQLQKFEAAQIALCDSFQSKDAVSETPSEKYLNDMLLLADILLQVDPGKTPMDCFGPYYIAHRKVLDAQLEKMDKSVKGRLHYELYLAHKGLDSN